MSKPETPCLPVCRKALTYPSNGIGWRNSDSERIIHAPACPNAPKAEARCLPECRRSEGPDGVIETHAHGCPKAEAPALKCVASCDDFPYGEHAPHCPKYKPAPPALSPGCMVGCLDPKFHARYCSPPAPKIRRAGDPCSWKKDGGETCTYAWCDCLGIPGKASYQPATPAPKWTSPGPGLVAYDGPHDHKPAPPAPKCNHAKIDPSQPCDVCPPAPVSEPPSPVQPTVALEDVLKLELEECQLAKEAAERDSSASMELYRSAVARRDAAEAERDALKAEVMELKAQEAAGWDSATIAALKAQNADQAQEIERLRKVRTGSAVERLHNLCDGFDEMDKEQEARIATLTAEVELLKAERRECEDGLVRFSVKLAEERNTTAAQANELERLRDLIVGERPDAIKEAANEIRAARDAGKA